MTLLGCTRDKKLEGPQTVYHHQQAQKLTLLTDPQALYKATHLI